MHRKETALHSTIQSMIVEVYRHNFIEYGFDTLLMGFTLMNDIAYYLGMRMFSFLLAFTPRIEVESSVRCKSGDGEMCAFTVRQMNRWMRNPSRSGIFDCRRSIHDTRRIMLAEGRERERHGRKCAWMDSRCHGRQCRFLRSTTHSHGSVSSKRNLL